MNLTCDQIKADNVFQKTCLHFSHMLAAKKATVSTTKLSLIVDNHKNSRHLLLLGFQRIHKKDKFSYLHFVVID